MTQENEHPTNQDEDQCRRCKKDGHIYVNGMCHDCTKVTQDFRAEPNQAAAMKQARPVIVVLCGSTRFYEAFQRANYEETMQGKIVLSVGFYGHSPYQMHGEAIGCTPEQKIALDELHKRKIDLADEVLVLNFRGYIGESTRSEIEYAVAHNKPVRYLEAPCSTK